MSLPFCNMSSFISSWARSLTRDVFLCLLSSSRPLILFLFSSFFLFSSLPRLGSTPFFYPNFWVETRFWRRNHIHRMSRAEQSFGVDLTNIGGLCCLGRSPINVTSLLGLFCPSSTLCRKPLIQHYLQDETNSRWRSVSVVSSNYSAGISDGRDFKFSTNVDGSCRDLT